jgi:hypothetical protein
VSEIPTEETLTRFDALLKRMNLRVEVNTPIKREADMVRDYYRDRETLGVDEAVKKWDPRFNDFYSARITLQRVVAAATALDGIPRLRGLLQEVLQGALTQDFEPSQSKDKFYELELAASLKSAGFSVALREPDIVASGNGLANPLAIACKYPSSRQQIHNHISCGYAQITRQDLDGVVAIGLDLLVARELMLPNRLDFRRGNTPPFLIMENRLEIERRKLEVERERDYPSERPLDGMMLTLSLVGIYDDPPTLTHLNSVALGCRPGNPLRVDLEIVKRKIEATNP